MCSSDLHDPATGNYAHSDYYFQTYADTKAACQASLSGWPTATCGAGTGFAKCVGKVGDGFLNTKTGDQFLHCTAVCPVHSHGTPPSCVCDTGYVFDAAGNCVLEQYTISLQIPPPAEVAAGASKSAYAEVTKSDGTVKSGVQVSLALTVVPELQGQLPITYTGSLSGYVGAIGTTTYSGSTGADGKLSFVFTAPVAGGMHTITATCTNPSCTNQATGTIKVPGCSVDPLKELPADDLCAQSLNAGLGKDVNGKCPPLDPRLPGQMQCFADKITATNVTARPPIPYAGPTATIRNTAYQAHLREVWDKMIKLNEPDNNNNEACRPLRDKVIAEKGCDSSGECLASTPSTPHCMAGSHCIKYRPATFSNHSTGTAFDVPEGTVNGLLSRLAPPPPPQLRWRKTLRPLPPTIQMQRKMIADWLAKPAACNLYWGGNFTDPGPDYIHFQLP